MSLFTQHDCSVWLSSTWILGNLLLKLVKSELPLLGKATGLCNQKVTQMDEPEVSSPEGGGRLIS